MGAVPGVVAQRSHPPDPLLAFPSRTRSEKKELEHEPGRQLEAPVGPGTNRARIADRGDPAEGGQSREVRVGLAELRMIEYIERLQAEHQAGPLTDFDCSRNGAINLEEP